MAKERKAYKEWFDVDAAQALGAQIESVMPSFERRTFIDLVLPGLDQLEFSDRVQRFSDSLRACLPQDYEEAVSVLVSSLPAPLSDCRSVSEGWLQWPVGRFIADHGLAHFEVSMDAMVALTQRLSSEFAVRPFIVRYPERTLDALTTLTAHGSPHVRRWCSEGSRPRLPWGVRIRSLMEDPSPTFGILHALVDDPEPYVRRSVANHVNDVAKDHPKAAVSLCEGWLQGATPHRRWVTRHGLRSLLKAGDTSALRLMGYGEPRAVEASLRLREAWVRVGDGVGLTAVVRNACERSQDLMVDYVVEYVRLGDRRSAHVFKWTTLTVAPRESVTLTKRHPMKRTTVRTLYAGEHRITLQINGVPMAEARFSLVCDG